MNILEGEWWKAVEEARAEFGHERREGEFTIGEYAQRFGKSITTSRHELNVMVDAGKLGTRLGHHEHGGKQRFWWVK